MPPSSWRLHFKQEKTIYIFSLTNLRIRLKSILISVRMPPSSWRLSLKAKIRQSAWLFLFNLLVFYSIFPALTKLENKLKGCEINDILDFTEAIVGLLLSASPPAFSHAGRQLDHFLLAGSASGSDFQGGCKMREQGRPYRQPPGPQF